MLFEIFMGQLRLLFGLRSDSSHVDLGISRYLSSKNGFAEWYAANFSFIYIFYEVFLVCSCQFIF